MRSSRAAIAGAILTFPLFAPAQAPIAARIDLRSNWRLNSSAVVTEDGATISTSRFQPRGWYAVSVPITVLNALTKRKVYPDMRIGLNAYRIPDASDDYNKQQNRSQYSHLPDKRNPWTDPWWYRTTFPLPKTAAGTHTWLHFDSINYRAEVWLNGHLVAGRDRLVGMNRRYALDISQWAAAGPNHLAVKVWRVDHVGPPGPPLKPLAGNLFEDHRSDGPLDYAIGMAGGYDCFPTIPDRYMGILQDVWIDFSGPVVVRDPFVITELPLPHTDSATLKISATVINVSDQPVSGVLRGAIAEAGMSFETNVSLGPGESRQVAFDPAVMKNPKLWWPNGYGAQHRYDLELRFAAGKAVSAAQRVRFGVRQITTEMYVYNQHHGRRILVNGQKIYARGGYIQPEALWDWDKERIDAEMRYYAQAHLTLIYFEDVANPPDFLMEACDRYGIMFGNCFYGCSWMVPGSRYPGDIPLVIDCTRDIIKRYRNHPSLILYMAMNEGATREDVYEPWRASLIELDGTRFWIPSATFADLTPEEIVTKRRGRDFEPWFKKDMPVGMTDTGASYRWVEPSEYYRRVREDPAWMFMMESGLASLPPMSSLAKFLPDLDEPSEGAPFPLNGDWALHGANEYYRNYDQAIRRIFGEPATVADYAWQGHLITADSNRAMFEAVNHRLWDITSGFTQWKINSAWPEVQWQIFDWYLKPMVSYPFIQRANEPLHIQLGLIEPVVTVVNQTQEPRRALVARARVFDASMRMLFDKRENLEIGASGYRDVFEIPKLANLPPVYFVRLDLSDAAGNPLSSNLYWLPAQKGGSMQAMRSLPLVPVEVRQTVEEKGGRVLIHAVLQNQSDKLAVMVQAAATRSGTGEEILPVYWSDNYISLMPNERRTLTADVSKAALRGAAPVVEVGGWNVRGSYKCTALDVPASADSDKPVTIGATIADTFLDGSRVDAMVDGKIAASQFHMARSGRSAAAKFNLQLAKGSHTIAVGERTASIIVRTGR